MFRGQVVGALCGEPVVAHIQRTGDAIEEHASRLQRRQPTAAPIAVMMPTVAAAGSRRRARARKAAERDGWSVVTSREQPRDEKAGNDKEDVHPDVAAGDTRYACVVEHDRDDGDGAQALDVWAKSGPLHPPLLRTGAGGGLFLPDCHRLS